jgi:probable blue pigment (indigoidine) exporter
MLASAYLLITILPPAPLWQAVTRVLPAGAVLLALHPALPHGSWWWRSLVLGTLNFGSFFALQAYSLSVLQGGISATIAAMQTVVVPVAAALLLGERLRPIQLAAAPVGVFGVALLVLRGSGTLHGPGVAAAALMALCVAGGMLLTRLWHVPAGVHHVTATAWQMLAGGLLLLPAALLIEGPMPSMTVTEWMVTGWLTFGATAVPFVAVFGAMHHGLPATVVSRVMLLCPLLVAVGDWLFYRHSLTLVQLAGAALVILSVAAVCSRRDGRMVAGWAPRIPAPRSPHAH